MINIDSLKTELPDLDDLATIEALDAYESKSIKDELGVERVLLVHREKAKKVATFNMINVKRAVESIKTLPTAGEYIHIVVGQAFTGFDLLPAMLDLAGADRFDELYLTTLGVSRDNLAQLEVMLQKGQIPGARLTILVCDFFRGGASELWDISRLMAQEWGFAVKSYRNHTKLILAAIGDRRYVVESSANLRGCTNIEQYVITESRSLYEFHAEWINRVMKVARI